jgi:hypothetical protein
MGLALSEGRRDDMAASNQIQLGDILQGYRFRVCETDEDARRSLAIRRQVYVEEKGVKVEVPDAYDRHSWLLIAEDAETGEAVGTMRITARAAGPLECEHSFILPNVLRGPDVLELSRFAIVRNHRQGKDKAPAVSLGLFKAMILFVERMVGAKRLVLCSKAERVHTYTMVCFRPTGVRAPYTALDGSMHEILFMDLRHGFEPYRDFPMYDYFAVIDSPEIMLPAVLPPLGLGTTIEVEAPIRATA